MANRKLIVEVIGDSKSFEKALLRSSKAGDRFSSTLSRKLRGIGLAATAAAGALAGFGTIAVRSSARFEESMQKIVGLSGVAQGKIEGLSDAVLKLAPEVGRGPQELAEGLLFITSSGVPAAKAMEVLAVSAKAAAAGLGETKTVADAVTSVMNAYGQANISAKEATDVLVATVREGKGEATDFAGVIGNVVSIASQLGVSFNDVGAALASMTRLGTDAETSATQLQQVFSNLVKVSPQQAKAFAAVGLSADELRKTLSEKGLLAGLEQIKTAFAGDLPGLAKAFGDIRALRGVLALVGNQSETTAGIFNRLADSSDALGIAFGAVSKTTAQQFRKMQAAAEVAKITIGAALAPLAGLVAKGLTAATTRLTAFFERIGEAKGIRAKLNIVWEGVEGAARDLAGQIGRAINNIDWDAVMRGAAAGLRNAGRVLAGIDWRSVGQEVGNRIAAAFAAIGDIIRRIDWSKVGQALVEGLVQFIRGVNWSAVAVGAAKLIAAAFKANVQFIRGAGEALARAMLDGLKDGLARVANFVKRKALEIALAIVEPFNIKILDHSLVPGLDGVIKTLKGKLAEMEAAAKTSAEVISETLQAAANPDLGRPARESGTQAPSAAGTPKIKIPVVVPDPDVPTGQPKWITRWEKAAAHLQLAVDKAGLALDKAGLTIGLKDDIAAIKEISAALVVQEKAIRDQIALHPKNLDLQKQLLDVQRAQVSQEQALADAVKKRADNQKAAAKAAIQQAQFKALGLSPEGQKPIPTIDNLTKQLNQLDPKITGGKNQGVLNAIRKALTDPVNQATDETRAAIRDMFATIRGELDDGLKGPLTKTSGLNTKKIIEGLGLDPETANQIRSRLSGFNSAGRALAGATASTFRPPVGVGAGAAAGMIQVDSTIFLDGAAVGLAVTRHQQKTGRRNPKQKRGPNRIGGV